MKKLLHLAVCTAATLAFAAPAQADPVDLSSWTNEGDGNWVLGGSNDEVTQTLNNNPTVFYSDFNAFGNELAGTIRVNTTSDDDFIGFVLGFNPGDLTAPSTNFLVVDWKQGDQGSFGCTANAGLAVSLATQGLGNNAGGWCHAGNGVTELARATTLSDTSWTDLTEYSFELEYTPTNLKVFVDGLLELDVDGTFSDGRFGFYNYSQANVTYAGVTTAVLPPPTGAVPEPATWAMMILGFGAIGGTLRGSRRRRSLFAA